MKKILFIALLLSLSVGYNFAQTNTFPAIGNVGIGTTTPRLNLDIKTYSGNEGSNLYFGDRRFYIAGLTGNGNNLQMYGGLVLNNITSQMPGVRALDFVIGDNNFTTTTNPESLKMRLLSNGNLGVGVAIPQAKLHLNNGDNSYGAILAQATEAPFQLYTKSLTTVRPAGEIFTDREAFRLGLKYSSDERNGFISFYRGGDTFGGYLGFSTNGTERIRVAANGFVGIGTTTPDKELTVNGSIHAKEVIVNLQIPLADYVFEPTYNLTPLAEVEKFVKEEKHLPDMPSAAEVAEKGLNMGEMQNKLLQKVEELTLYVIEQQKLIAGQQNLLSGQQSQIAGQQNLLSAQQAQIDELKQLIQENRLANKTW